jgi:hypothetical protein
MARTVLVSFLGKGKRATEEQPRSHLGYRTARYDFNHLGGSDEESAMFGLALLRHLRAQNQKPNVWLVLGSPQSSWDALIEAVDIEALGSQQMETLNTLLQQVEEAVKQEETHPSSKGSDFLTETLLQEWARTLTMHLHPTQVRCFLIGWSYDRAEQEQLWKILSEQTEEQDRLILDITHGVSASANAHCVYRDAPKPSETIIRSRVLLRRAGYDSQDTLSHNPERVNPRAENRFRERLDSSDRSSRHLPRDGRL